MTPFIVPSRWIALDPRSRISVSFWAGVRDHLRFVDNVDPKHASDVQVVAAITGYDAAKAARTTLTRAIPGPPVNGQPSWYGQWRRANTHAWRTASSDYGFICYASAEAAEAGAKFDAGRRS